MFQSIRCYCKDIYFFCSNLSQAIFTRHAVSRAVLLGRFMSEAGCFGIYSSNTRKLRAVARLGTHAKESIISSLLRPCVLQKHELQAVPEVFLCNGAGSIKKKPFSGPAHLIMLSESNSSGNSSNLQRNQHFNLILIKIFPKKYRQ